ncbi:DegT/DnrJ/EryC1/StrS family aminotransferase [Flavobacterium qiangtangense]|uniref:DegT/DnrJ/EryC1/StrS family aminotransferase n=1 Tax=Flavobacterium qiangtangense TaxID=1442595 RepID=A0ABW1PS30_9FLAO
MISVTKTFLPPIAEYTAQLERAWNKNWITNRGELIEELEEKLKSYLSLSNIIITTNGTIPLQIALKLLGEKGEIITTPFSYVATSAAIVWENCTPIFVDIHPNFLTIDETKIETAITEKTTAILATHVFGNPCAVEKIEKIATKHNLKVIYDGAHAFGVSYKNRSLLSFGTVSTCSFHATKIFHTGEGGAMITNDTALYEKLFYSHNFGHKDYIEFSGLGINGKASELQATMGLSVLPHFPHILEERKKIIKRYTDFLNFSKYRTFELRPETQWNYSYYPIIFETEELLVSTLRKLNEQQIFPRRYFYPSLNTIDYTKGNVMPISESIASRIACLPLYVGLTPEEQDQIISILNSL